jgi:hypothetical protein
MLQRLLLRSAIIALLFSTSGCGILIQTVMGWSERYTERRTEKHRVDVSSEPAGAEIKRKNPGGSIENIGPAPFTDQVTYEVDVTIAKPRYGGLLAGGLLDLAISIGLIYAMHADGNGEPVTDVYILSLVAIPELIAAAVWGNSGLSVKARTQVPSSQWYTYYANVEGAPEASISVNAPNQGRAEFRLGALPLVQRMPEPEPEDEPGQMKTEVEPEPGWVIAVMNVEDLNAAKKEQAIDKALIESLGDQLRIVIAQQGVRTIDREIQDRALSDQLTVMAGDKACNDDSCQIELGKALSASHIIRARVSRFGGKCVFNAELIDLSIEETSASSSAQGECVAQGLFNMSEEAAKRLVAKSPTQR